MRVVLAENSHVKAIRTRRELDRNAYERLRAYCRENPIAENRSFPERDLFILFAQAVRYEVPGAKPLTDQQKALLERQGASELKHWLFAAIVRLRFEKQFGKNYQPKPDESLEKKVALTHEFIEGAAISGKEINEVLARPYLSPAHVLQ